MRTVLLLFLFASPAFAQSTPAVAIAPGCGGSNVSFSVTTNKNQHPFVQPDAGKALVYFVEDDSNFNAAGKPTVRAGLDGAWVGATHGSSYFYFPVDAGEHHLCASWQGKGQQSYAAAANFDAKAGELYFFQVRDTFLWPNGSSLTKKIDLKPVNGDEGQLLASRYSFSTSHARK
jgi:Protein of unknown function (DUF2846)